MPKRAAGGKGETKFSWEALMEHYWNMSCAEVLVCIVIPSPRHPGGGSPGYCTHFTEGKAEA